MKEFHFFASSACMWATTTEERDLRALLKMMDKDGHTYNLFYVPLPHNAAYQIKAYAPAVEGVVFLGSFEPRARKGV
jgi:hypothetical protein